MTYKQIIGSRRKLCMELLKKQVVINKKST